RKVPFVGSGERVSLDVRDTKGRSGFLSSGRIERLSGWKFGRKPNSAQRPSAWIVGRFFSLERHRMSTSSSLVRLHRQLSITHGCCRSWRVSLTAGISVILIGLLCLQR